MSQILICANFVSLIYYYHYYCVCHLVRRMAYGVWEDDPIHFHLFIHLVHDTAVL